ncbi:CHASE2 domain-containing protein [Methylomonas sp. MgM2]
MQNVAKRLPVSLAVLIVLIAGNTGLYIWDPLPLKLFRNNTFDYYQRLKPRPYQDAPVTIVDIDDEGLKRLGQWPWPRTQIAKLISALQTSGPAAIALDIIFAEKDRTSPKVMSELWQLSPTERQVLSRLPDHDRALAESIANGKSVLGFALNETAGADAPKLPARFIEIGHSSLPFLHAFEGSIQSLAMLEAAASGNGALTFVVDSDGVIRKVPVALRYRNQIVPSLFMEALRVAQQTDNYILRSHDEAAMGLAEISVGNIRIPTTEKGEIWLYYSRPANERYIPAWRILEGHIGPERLKDKILLIGASAPGIMDLRISPLGTVIPGIEVHAQALEQVLSGTQLVRPFWHASLEVFFLLGGGLIVGCIALSYRIATSLTVFLLSLTGFWAVSWRAFAEYRLLIDPMVPTIGLLVVFLYSSLFRHFHSERRQRWIKHAFSRYVSPNLVDYLIAHPQELELSGRRRNCSFVFTDLTDFTALMEDLDPRHAVNLLNEYLENMIAIAFSHQGTLDRIVGDSVAILFSAPIKQNDHQRRAIQCALDMQEFTRRYSRCMNDEGIAFGQTRIGVHSGPVIVGNFGGKTIFDYRALGDPVNTASRLESANKYLGTLICVSETTLKACPDMLSRPIGHLSVKGKANPLMVFEPLSPKNADLTALAEYDAAYRLMQNKRPEAIAAFQRIIDKNPNDTLAYFHLQRLLKGERDDLIRLDRK